VGSRDAREVRPAHSGIQSLDVWTLVSVAGVDEDRPVVIAASVSSPRPQEPNTTTQASLGHGRLALDVDEGSDAITPYVRSKGDEQIVGSH